MKSQITLNELTRIALFGAVGFVFYILTGPIVDTLLPFLGCLIRPVLFLSFITSQYHLNQRQLFYISVISSLLYAFVVPCFLNYTSIPVSAIFVLVLTIFRNRMNRFVLVIVSSISAFLALIFFAFFLSPKKSDFIAILKSFPYIIIIAIVMGFFQIKFGKINCQGCDICDPVHPKQLQKKPKGETNEPGHT
ncbi:hypothetical protein LLG10_07590 [bacterium]|nr:hypothetical protein [bacterium]